MPEARGARPEAVLAVCLGLFLTASVVGKLVRPVPTLDVLRDVWHLPGGFDAAVFVVLCVVEAALAIWLLCRWRLTAGLLAAAAFFLAVSASPALQLATGSDRPCGCGSPLASTEPATPSDHWRAIARNVLLAGPCLGLALTSPHRRTR